MLSLLDSVYLENKMSERGEEDEDCGDVEA